MCQKVRSHRRSCAPGIATLLLLSTSGTADAQRSSPSTPGNAGAPPLARAVKADGDRRIPTQADLRKMAGDDIQSGSVSDSPVRIRVVNNRYLRVDYPKVEFQVSQPIGRGSPDAGVSEGVGMVLTRLYRRQCEVESIRRSRLEDSEQALGGSVLERAEREIAKALDELAAHGPRAVLALPLDLRFHLEVFQSLGLDQLAGLAVYGPQALSNAVRWDLHIREIYEDALMTYAVGRRLRYVPNLLVVKRGLTVRELKELADDTLGCGSVRAMPPVVSTPGGGVLRWTPARVVVEQGFLVDGGDRDIKSAFLWIFKRQCEVEVIRRSQAHDPGLAFLSPVLGRVEEEIGTALANHLQQGTSADAARWTLRVGQMIDDAVRAHAAKAGLRLEYRFSQFTAPDFGGAEPGGSSYAPINLSFKVRLTTLDGKGTILLAPWLDWRLSVLHNGGNARDTVFLQIAPGTELNLVGVYIYQIRDSSGRTSEPRRARISSGGEHRLP